MPFTLKVRVNAARNLPAMERSLKGMEYAEAYCTISFGNETARTLTEGKTLNPCWDEEFRFDIINDSILLTTPLEFHVFDEDVYSTDDSIGVILIDLGSLLMRSSLRLLHKFLIILKSGFCSLHLLSGKELELRGGTPSLTHSER